MRHAIKAISLFFHLLFVRFILHTSQSHMRAPQWIPQRIGRLQNQQGAAYVCCS